MLFGHDVNDLGIALSYLYNSFHKQAAFNGVRKFVSMTLDSVTQLKAAAIAVSCRQFISGLKIEVAQAEIRIDGVLKGDVAAAPIFCALVISLCMILLLREDKPIENRTLSQRLMVVEDVRGDLFRRWVHLVS